MSTNKCTVSKIEQCKNENPPRECNPSSGRCKKIKINKKPKSNKIKNSEKNIKKNIKKMSDIDKLIYNFYNSKEKYETIIKKKIIDIKMKDISYENRKNAQKDDDFVLLWKSSNKTKNKIKQIKQQMKCLFCEQEGGMKFIDDTDKYEMKCLGKNPCSHLLIKKGKICQYTKIKKEITEEINNFKEKIIKCKLKILYNLEDENIILEQFQSLKELLDKSRQELAEIEKINTSKNSIQIIDEEDEEKNKTILRKDKINELKKELNKLISKLKDIKILVKKELIEEKKEELKSDYIHTYIDSILPIINKIHILKYDGELYNENENENENVTEDILEDMNIAYTIETKTIDGIKQKIIYKDTLQMKNKEILLEKAKKEINKTNFLK
jgi:hypothetical protein